MRFERTLGMRYVRAQKRHSVLTVCSIMIAVALITMICTVYTTYQGITRAAIYNEAPYHMLFEHITAEQAAEIGRLDEVESVETEPNENGTVKAMVLFCQYLDNEYIWAYNLQQKMDLDCLIKPYDPQTFDLIVNTKLLEADNLCLHGRAKLVQNLAILLVCLLFFVMALRMVIDTAFEISSKEREKQFGILQSLGAEPRQIVRILSTEGLILSVFGIPLGLLLGVLLSYLTYRLVLTTGIAQAFYSAGDIDKVISFHINPLLLGLSAAVGLVWVFFSAYGTGMRIIKKPPLEAITARAETVDKVSRFNPLAAFFGWKGKLASRNAKRNPKRFFVTVVSLTVSLTMFAALSSYMGIFKQSLLQSMQMDETTEEIIPYFTFALNDGGVLNEDNPPRFPELIKQMRDTGYFSRIENSNNQFVTITCADQSQHENVHLTYVNEDSYHSLLGDQQPFSYEELVKRGGGLLVNISEDEIPADAKTICFEEEYLSQISEAEYESKESDKESKIGFLTHNGETLYYERTPQDYEFPVCGRCMLDNSEDELNSEVSMIVMPEERWIGGDCYLFSNLQRDSYIAAFLKDETVYEPALQWLKAHSTDYLFDSENDAENPYRVYIKMQSTVSAINIGFTAMMIMIGLIAIVNMVNIISTGILNRKRELAAMQCVGMTRGQMYGMTVIECLQFTLWAAVAASVLTLLLLFLTTHLLNIVDLSEMKSKLFSWTEPLIKIWGGGIIAFLFAILASFLPLHQMQKEPLVEQIRNVE